mgnify:CR=1 FL=1
MEPIVGPRLSFGDGPRCKITLDFADKVCYTIATFKIRNNL